GSPVALRHVRCGGPGLTHCRARIELDRPFEGQLGVGRLFPEQERLADPLEEVWIARELPLDLRQGAVALDDELGRMALHSAVDVRNAQIALLQVRSRLPPGDDAGGRRKTRECLGAALDPVIGERGMAPVLGIAPRHVAGETVRVFRGMRGWKSGSVAG